MSHQNLPLEKAPKPYTKAMLDQFDRLTMKLSSLNNLKRIEARFALSKFQEEHGENVCREMFEVLKRRDAKKGVNKP